MNCIGYACERGGNWQPDPLQSVADMLKEEHWKCESVETSGNCKCDCAVESAVMVYIYITTPKGWKDLTEKEKQDYINRVRTLFSNPFEDRFWPGTLSPLDVHAIRRDCREPEGSPKAWDYVPHDLPRNPDGGFPSGTVGNPDDYWDKDGKRRLLAKRCCKKSK